MKSYLNQVITLKTNQTIFINYIFTYVTNVLYTYVNKIHKNLSSTIIIIAL